MQSLFSQIRVFHRDLWCLWCLWCLCDNQPVYNFIVPRGTFVTCQSVL